MGTKNLFPLSEFRVRQFLQIGCKCNAGFLIFIWGVHVLAILNKKTSNF